jgi:hypothetical protein
MRSCVSLVHAQLLAQLAPSSVTRGALNAAGARVVVADALQACAGKQPVQQTLERALAALSKQHKRSHSEW